ncbi:MAG: hypothetical protein KJN71_08505, partial [Acidimicrobiia bacterium]|nr:hypothetical protein [Acidimicrobiia bacterium]
MTRRLFCLLAAVALATGACALQEPASLDDPELLDRVGVDTPSDITWTRTIEGVEVAGTTASADPRELSILASALREVPDA